MSYSREPENKGSLLLGSEELVSLGEWERFHASEEPSPENQKDYPTSRCHMNYHMRMLPICNSISMLMAEKDLPGEGVLGEVLTHVAWERPMQALELVCRHKKAALLPTEKAIYAQVEEELALAIISHSQSILELQTLYKIAELSVENKMVLWARAAGLKYQSPIPVRED